MYIRTCPQNNGIKLSHPKKNHAPPFSKRNFAALPANFDSVAIFQHGVAKSFSTGRN
ncbi:MAG: hypothetical protein K2X57_31315 [Xanthobacteraceae bacterium]|nr:hypothetical protein [Xanthobacteraceae bacterium]